MVNFLDEVELRNLLKTFKTDGTFESVKLVIISACYSGDIAKLLFEAGFPTVVAISSDS